MDVLRRVLPGARADQFVLRPIGGSANGDRYRVSGAGGRIEVAGTSPAVLLTGVHAYLKQVVHASVTWNGDSLAQLPDVLPAPPEPITGQAVVPHRYVGNETWTGYTDAYWTFEDWRREIDILAMNGINEILVLVGQVSVYFDTFMKFGYSGAELREWIPLPSQQPWFHLQTMHTILPVPKSVMDQQADLARRIIGYLQSLGMTPVFPGYFGMVPPGFTAKYPDASVIPQGSCGPYERVDQLDPTNTYFARIADTFYEIQSSLFGDTTMYNINIVHEGGNPGTTPIPSQARAIESALQRAHPGAIWTMLGWWHNPLRVVLDALDKPNLLVLDGMADITRVDPQQEFNGTPYAFGSIWNYGGRTYMRARMAAWVEDFHAWRTQPDSQLCGVAVLPEANNTNPAAFTLMTELAWRSDKVDFGEWLREFSIYRYGQADEQARTAWQILGETAYALEMPPPGPLPVETADPFVPIPDVTQGPQLALNPLRYEHRFDEVLEALLNVEPAIRDTTAYRYDLLDVARQALANHAFQLHADMCIAYKERKPDKFAAVSATWLRWMRLLDELLCTNSQTLLGRSVANAAQWGESAEDKRATRYDTLSVLTIRAAKEGLGDYAGRAWAGLTGGYYHDRWRTYIDEVQKALKEDRKPKTFDWHGWGNDWIEEQREFVAEPTGDVVALATEVLREIKRVSAPATTRS